MFRAIAPTRHASLSDADVARVLRAARRAHLARILFALGAAGGFVALAIYSRGPVVALWHVGFSISLLALGWALFALHLHRRALRTLADDLVLARALNLSPDRFWAAHAAVFPLKLP